LEESPPNLTHPERNCHYFHNIVGAREIFFWEENGKGAWRIAFEQKPDQPYETMKKGTARRAPTIFPYGIGGGGFGGSFS
jgi:hypothetical protein